MRALRSCVTIHRMLLCSICFTNWSMKVPNAGGADPHPPAVPLGEKVRAVGEARERRRIVQDAKPGLLHRRAERARDLRRRTRSTSTPAAAEFSEQGQNPSHVSLWMVRKTLSAQETNRSQVLPCATALYLTHLAPLRSNSPAPFCPLPTRSTHGYSYDTPSAGSPRSPQLRRSWLVFSCPRA